jgi:hypothetical protein
VLDGGEHPIPPTLPVDETSAPKRLGGTCAFGAQEASDHVWSCSARQIAHKGEKSANQIRRLRAAQAGVGDVQRNVEARKAASLLAERLQQRGAALVPRLVKLPPRTERRKKPGGQFDGERVAAKFRQKLGEGRVVVFRPRVAGLVGDTSEQVLGRRLPNGRKRDGLAN